MLINSLKKKSNKILFTWKRLIKTEKKSTSTCLFFDKFLNIQAFKTIIRKLEWLGKKKEINLTQTIKKAVIETNNKSSHYWRKKWKKKTDFNQK